jgi:hypothetical protein
MKKVYLFLMMLFASVALFSCGDDGDDEGSDGP